MTCPQVRQNLDAFRTGEVDSVTRSQVESHLGRCDQCRHELAIISRLAGQLATLPRVPLSLAEAAPATPAGTPEPMHLTTVDTPLGLVQVGYRRRRIVYVNPRMDNEQVSPAALAERFGAAVESEAEPPDWVRRALAAALAGRSARQSPVDLSGLRDFERAVLEKTREIPAGEVRTYAWLAREIGRPGAVRAVGTALGRNPVPMLVPCHRIVRSDLSLGNYAFGPELKAKILAGEGLPPERLADLAAQGVRYQGSRTTRIFCFPTCYTGRRMKEQYRVSFASSAEARNAGYRPCKVCRPEAADSVAS